MIGTSRAARPTAAATDRTASSPPRACTARSIAISHRSGSHSVAPARSILRRISGGTAARIAATTSGAIPISPRT